MPSMGSMGAPSRRQQLSAMRPASSMGYPAAGTPEDSAGWEMASCTSNMSKDSMSSVLTKLKQQAWETGGFFKKKQQALLEKVQKGLNLTVPPAAEQQTQARQMSAGARQQPQSGLRSRPAQTKSAEKPAQEEENGSRESIEEKRAAWTGALEQMVFEPGDIQESLMLLGKRALQIDDVIQVLAAKQPTTSGGASSSNIFVATLRRTRWDRLGIIVDTSGAHVVVDEVSEGLVQRWNAGHPNLCVRPGDVILEVNGKEGCPKDLVAWLTRSSAITLKITVRASRKDFLDGGSSSSAISPISAEAREDEEAALLSHSADGWPTPVGAEGSEATAENDPQARKEEAVVNASCEISIPDLARKVVASAVLRALANQEAKTPPKVLVEERLTPSPMRGGA